METIQQLEHRLTELKSDFVRIQGDIEKVETTGGNVAAAMKQLTAIEDEIASVRKQIADQLKSQG
ncbi:SE1832 family protein [Shouchella shacheensis]|uniref:SE1832 family protein n=1 Tax=Shouchella shacheensis TaxID=1649580 RepID=UPI00073FDBB9|nr:SE1832 family protein [Shouchella shacheensis]